MSELSSRNVVFPPAVLLISKTLAKLLFFSFSKKDLLSNLCIWKAKLNNFHCHDSVLPHSLSSSSFSMK